MVFKKQPFLLHRHKWRRKLVKTGKNKTEKQKKEKEKKREKERKRRKSKQNQNKRESLARTAAQCKPILGHLNNYLINDLINV